MSLKQLLKKEKKSLLNSIKEANEALKDDIPTTG